ncbi:hemerythrin domain-containing protein [Myxococcota bacterium]|nr:hemerythrin domain-containing protein [Myxococcota bacterium]
MAGRSAKATIDHQEIRSWVESHGGAPAHVKRTGGGDDPGILRIDFPGYGGRQSLEPLSWDRWFEAFEANGLAFLYQDTPDSRFNKLVRRESTSVDAPAEGHADAASSGAAESIIEVLHDDHQKVRALFALLKKSGGREERQDMFDELTIAIHVHSRAEQECVYSALAESMPSAKKLLDEAIVEHLEVERSLADLDDLGVDDDDFMERLDELEGAIEAHVQREESTIFGELERAFDEPELERMARDFEEARDAALARGDLSATLDDTIEELPGA